MHKGFLEILVTTCAILNFLSETANGFILVIDDVGFCFGEKNVMKKESLSNIFFSGGLAPQAPSKVTENRGKQMILHKGGWEKI